MIYVVWDNEYQYCLICLIFLWSSIVLLKHVELQKFNVSFIKKYGIYIYIVFLYVEVIIGVIKIFIFLLM